MHARRVHRAHRAQRQHLLNGYTVSAIVVIIIIIYYVYMFIVYTLMCNRYPKDMHTCNVALAAAVHFIHAANL